MLGIIRRAAVGGIMSIVFDEVSGEIASQRPDREDDTRETPSEDGPALDEKIRCLLRNEQRRQARLSDR
jgi:hypothetical protein